MAVQRDVAVHTLKARDRPQQGGLTRPVWPDQCGKRSTFERGQRDVLYHPMASVGHAHIMDSETRHSFLPRLNTRITKTGTPTSAVTMPTGTITPGRMSLLAMDDSDMSNAPTSALAGKRKR